MIRAFLVFSRGVFVFFGRLESSSLLLYGAKNGEG